MNPRARASLSLDLDNKWTYLKTRGNPAWQGYPSYLDIVVPRLLNWAERHNLVITVFIVGKDAALPHNRLLLKSIAEAGHEIGNHSFNHEPWLHEYDRGTLLRDIAEAEEAISNATGRRPVGFRGPGYSLSKDTLEILLSRGYQYDASTLPTWIGSLARAYYFLSSDLKSRDRRQRSRLFGEWSDGLQPNRPYYWQLSTGRLLEMPVSTMPGLKLPFHASYLIWLSETSPKLARGWLLLALALCVATGVAPSVLLHPLDFLGPEDGHDDLTFFPGMRVSAVAKIHLLDDLVRSLKNKFEVGSIRDHAHDAARGRLAPNRIASSPKYGKRFA